MLGFNSATPAVMHLDVNSCFASIEQQFNPALRGKPVVVAAYATDHGCILAASREAKKLGIKTGMRVREAKLIYPQLSVLEPDPPKYRFIHEKLKSILESYSENVIPKSIDEFVMDLKGYPAERAGMKNTACEIKQRIKQEIGQYLTVSIGISTNRYLAKVASDIEKPDGLVEINKKNFLKIYEKMKLTDLSGIKKRNAIRLYAVGIKNVIEMYSAPVAKLRAAFHGICGYYWWLRLRGREIDEVKSEQKSFGAQYVLPKATDDKKILLPILQKLTEKMGWRLRQAGKQARGVHLAIFYANHTFFHHGENFASYIFNSCDLYARAKRIFEKINIDSGFHRNDNGGVREIAVSCFNTAKNDCLQTELFDNIEKKNKLTEAMDKINFKFGDYHISPASLFLAPDAVPDRIAFGK